jgi:4-hydroxy-4-methyl-2-oxoglutarate aldolase
MVATGEYDKASVIGDLVVGMMRNVGIVAAVTDGLVRDIPGIREVGIPVYARGVSPNSPFKHGPGTIGLPISIGGVAVEGRRRRVGDSDGVVVVPSWRVDEAVRELAAVRAKEAGHGRLRPGRRQDPRLARRSAVRRARALRRLSARWL